MLNVSRGKREGKNLVAGKYSFYQRNVSILEATAKSSHIETFVQAICGFTFHVFEKMVLIVSPLYINT